MDNHHVFARSTTSPFNVALPATSEKIEKIYLQQFILKGVPVTAGVPNSVNYNLLLENTSASLNLYARNDSLPGIPLPIDAGYTSRQMNPLIHIGNANGTKIANFTIRITDENGNAATFTDAAFWFYIE